MAAMMLTPLRWMGDHLSVLDQRALPAERLWIRCDTVADVVAVIANMAVRGAPAIGLAGAYGLAIAALRDEDIAERSDMLCAARPTAVHLAWALNTMRTRCAGKKAAAWVQYAQQLHTEDAELNFSMATHGAELIASGSRVMTHCNTGALATGGWGTALGVIRVAHRAGKISEVLAGETRPWLQGARLTAWELQEEQIPYRLVADGAMAWAMQQLRPAWVIVGADRIAANGDTANKIGTFSLAVLARSLGVKFMVVAPQATIDPTLSTGADIPIEERPGAELTRLAGRAIAPEDAQAWNPVFDVTPATLIDALVTEHGVIHMPDREQLSSLVSRTHGD